VKEALYFVWERSVRGGMIAHLQPAIYRGIPQTGMGQVADDRRFAFRKELDAKEMDMTLKELVEKYPRPIEEET